MNIRRLLPVLLLALAVSGGFTFWLSRHSTKPVSAAPVVVPTKHFVAVNKNLEPGEQIQLTMLQMVDWPASHPLQGAFLKPEELAGRIVLSPIATGEIVLARNLVAPGTPTGMTARIPEGLRAISLRSDEVAGVAGFLLPGTFVDVLVTYRPDAEKDMVTATVLQNVRVLAAGQKMEPEPDGKATAASVVTLLVSPQEAEKLTLASSLGKILFVLRNSADRKEVADLTPQSSLSGTAPRGELRPATAINHQARPAPPPVPKYTVQTIAGNKLTEDTFEGKAK